MDSGAVQWHLHSPGLQPQLGERVRQKDGRHAARNTHVETQLQVLEPQAKSLGASVVYKTTAVTI